MSTNMWAIIILAFLAGLCIGLLFSTGRKWKRRYHEEVVRRQTFETENERLRREDREKDMLRHAAARERTTGRVDPDRL